MYIMCVCLFSALSRSVGALQISIIIIKSLVLVGGGVGEQIAVVRGGVGEWEGGGGGRELNHSFVMERRVR